MNINRIAFFFIRLCLPGFLTIATAYAQPTVDSVSQALKKYQKEDTVKVEMLVDACVNSSFSANDIVLEWATQARTLALQLNYVTGQIRATNCLGNYYYNRGVFDKATGYYLDALRLSESRNDAGNIMISKSNVANVLTHMNKYKEGIRLFKECDQMLIQKGDTLSQKRAAILTNLATAYSKAGLHDSAIFHYNKVYSICKKLNIGFGIGITITNLASEYFQLRKYPETLTRLAEGEVFIKKFNLDFLEPEYYGLFGQTYFAQGQTKKAIDYLKLALAAAQKKNDLETSVATYKTLQQAYAQAHNYEQAFQTAQIFVTLKDSLDGIAKDKTVSELNTKYETEKKEVAIKQLQQENTITQLQSQRKDTLLMAVSGLALLTALTGFALFSRYRTRKENQALSAAIEFEQKINKSILTSIKAQMNPHFFYNALNTIQSYIFSDDKRNATAYLNKFSTLTRMILEMSEKERVPLNQEIKALTLYLEIEKARFNDDFVFTINVDSSVDSEMITIPPMLIQPYVENAVKHGLLHKKEDRRLSLDFNRTEELLRITVQDNGIGRKRSEEINRARADRHASFSTRANQTRLELLNNAAGKKVGVEFIDQTDDQGNAAGTTVVITIPLAWKN